MAEDTKKWMKWRHKFSYAAGDWKWLEVEDKKDAKARLPDLAEEHDHSEQYRGIDYHLYDAPDLEWLKSHIEEEREAFRYQGQRIERLERFLSSLQEK